MEKEKINYGSMVDADKMYPVSYTIKQDGTKVIENTFLKGTDMTENQIKELYEFSVKFASTLKPTVDKEGLKDKMQEIQDRNYTKFKGQNEADLMVREDILELFLPHIQPQINTEDKWVSVKPGEKLYPGDVFLWKSGMHGHYEIHTFHSDAGYGAKTFTNYNEKDGSSMLVNYSGICGVLIPPIK